jgi:hypothetical protein
MNYLFKRSDTPNKRPNPNSMLEGEVLLNYAVESPGLFFKATDGSLVVAAPTSVATTAPNSTPAPGGLAGNSTGEMWFDISDPAQNQLKVFDGTSWKFSYGNPFTGYTDLTNLFLGVTPKPGFTGTNNTVIGKTGLQTLTSGSNNTFFGDVVGWGLTTNNYCTAVGTSTLGEGPSVPIVGDYATAVGSGALYRAKVITHCTAVGSDTLLYCQGEGNTAVGYQAATATTTGTYNIAVGWQALLGNKTGSNNIAIGKNALNQLVNDSGNIGIGSGAGSTAKAGSQNNVFMGLNAGPNSARTTPTIGNVYFGQYAGNGTTDGNNNIFIGGNCMAIGTTGDRRKANGSTFIGNFTVSNAPDVEFDSELLLGANGVVSMRINKFGAMSIGGSGFGEPGAPLIQDGTSSTAGPTRWFNDGPQATFISSDNKRVVIKYGIVQSITQL